MRDKDYASAEKVWEEEIEMLERHRNRLNALAEIVPAQHRITALRTDLVHGSISSETQLQLRQAQEQVVRMRSRTSSPCGSGTVTQQALITVEGARVTMNFSDPSSAGYHADNYLLTRSGPDLLRGFNKDTWGAGQGRDPHSGTVTPVSRKIVLGSSLLIGYVVMAFEMILGHYLNPYFGSSIFTWGAIISTVLIALGVGYFWGGALADRRPHGSLIGTLLCASAAYLAVIPFVADAALLHLVTRIEDIRVGALAAALLLSAPLTLLGMYCPFAVRLTTTDGKRPGLTAGRVYGVSTVGSVVGTLSVAFFLVLYMG